MEYDFCNSYTDKDFDRPFITESELDVIELNEDNESDYERTSTVMYDLSKVEKTEAIDHRPPTIGPIIRQATFHKNGSILPQKSDSLAAKGNRLPLAQFRVVAVPPLLIRSNNGRSSVKLNGTQQIKSADAFINGRATSMLTIPSMSPAGAGESTTGKPTISPSLRRPLEPPKIYYTAPTAIDVSQRVPSEVLERVGVEIRAENTRLRGDNARLTGELRRLTDQLRRAEADRERFSKMVTRIRSRPHRKMLPLDALSNHARHNRERLVAEMVAGSYPEKTSSPAAVEAFFVKVRERMENGVAKYVKSETRKPEKKKSADDDDEESSDEKM